MELKLSVGRDEVWADHVAGEGVPLVLLHPGIGDSRSWDPVMPALAGRRVVRYDVRGVGRSGAPSEEFSLRQDLVSVLDQLELERVVLVGCSMGGGTAIGFALDQPDRVQGLVLLCPGVPGFPMPDEPELDAEYAALVANRDVDGLVRFALRLWGAAGDDEATVAQLRSAIPAWFEQYTQADPPVYGRLHEINVPTAVMVGDKDRPILAAVAGATAARIPDAEFIWMPGVDHLPSLRVPGLVAETIQRIATA
ncbi:alpha/beta fold hydrolase [Kribbella sp. NPDC055071]